MVGVPRMDVSTFVQHLPLPSLLSVPCFVVAQSQEVVEGAVSCLVAPWSPLVAIL
jgi:hypothetical protein